MYEIYLTDSNARGAHPERVAELIAVDSSTDAHDLCVALQPFLRHGIEAHFVSAG